MADWRKIETAIEDYFRRQGTPAARAGGDLFVGAITPEVTHRSADDGHATTVLTIDEEEEIAFVSLSDLARELEALK